MVTNVPYESMAHYSGKNISRTRLFLQINSVHALRCYGYTVFSAYCELNL